MQNITFRADKALIERVREIARRRSTTLNQMFRDWLEELAREPGRLSTYDRLMKDSCQADSGGKFTRDEMNVR